MSGQYSSFNQLLKNAMVRIDAKQKDNSKAHQEFRENMRKLFNDRNMFPDEQSACKE